MNYQNPHASLIKICPTCGKEFDTIAYYNQVYCTVQCYRRAKTQRRIDRSKPDTKTKLEERREHILNAEAYFATTYCPTVKQLDDYAKVILLEMNGGKPIRVTGSIPEWRPPKNIAIVEQVGVTPREWLMVARESSPLDDLLNR